MSKEKMALCIKTDSLLNHLKETSTSFDEILIPDSDTAIASLFTEHIDVFKYQDLSLQPRSTCENDSSYLQIIPYVTIIQHSNNEEALDYKILSYSRGKGSAEKRLHAKRSIGFGGHIEDFPFDSIVHISDGEHQENTLTGERIVYIIANNAARELSEEIGIPFEVALANILYFGTSHWVLMYDGSDDVGKHHLAVAITIYMDECEMKMMNPDNIEILDLTLQSTTEMKDNLDQYEQWSKNLIQVHI